MKLSEQYTDYLRKRGYTISKTAHPGITECIREGSEDITVVQLVDLTEDVGTDKEVFVNQTNEIAATFGDEPVQVVSLFFVNDMKDVVPVAGDTPGFWVIIVDTLQIATPDDIGEELKELRDFSIDFLMRQRQQGESGDTKPAKAALALVIINAAAFVVSLLYPDIVKYGMMDYDRVSQGELYRLFTAMFLHGSIEHIVSNMVFLYVMGSLMEEKMGTVRFVVLYLLSGIIGNVTSYCYEMFSGNHYTSVGASGAVYGVLGAIVLFSLMKSIGIEMSKKRLALAIIFCVYSSVAMPGIDYAAHFGGFAGGFALAFAFRQFAHDSLSG